MSLVALSFLPIFIPFTLIFGGWYLGRDKTPMRGTKSVSIKLCLADYLSRHLSGQLLFQRCLAIFRFNSSHSAQSDHAWISDYHGLGADQLLA